MVRQLREDLSRMLPTEAYLKGYTLTWYDPRLRGYDPTILSLKGFTIYVWEHNPSMGEVWDKIKELEYV